MQILMLSIKNTISTNKGKSISGFPFFIFNTLDMSIFIYKTQSKQANTDINHCLFFCFNQINIDLSLRKN